MLRPESPVPGLGRGFALHPDDEADPYVFRVDLSKLGIGIVRITFGTEAGASVTAFHLDIEPLMSFDKQPALRNPRPWMTGALAVGTAAAIARRRAKRSKEPSP
jgi:hypothetical protein